MMKGVVFSLLGLILLMCACGSSKTKQERGKATVQADTVKSYQGELSIIYPGKIKAASEVKLSFRVAGPIRAVLPEVGAFVKKGELIAEIDPRDYEIQLSATEAEYNQVKEEAGRVIELYNRGSVPVNDYDKAVAGVKQITAKYDAHKNALADTRLTAPFDGYIQKKYYDSHETVAAGYPVVSMINSNYFDVDIDIPSSDFVAGMSVNVTIEYNPNEEALTVVPLSAMFEENGESAVWVYNPKAQNVTRRVIQLKKLLKTGELIVSEGLAAGEIVVSAGVHSLKEGMSVELLKPVSKTNVGGLL